ncbi:uridine phosphorylase [Neolewinella xylanilytica]|uniref:Uridine phosphorylase n=1 Tax=Neolewinella xylanilytica TaxID=1514080 RepID=A0A2S6I3D4_9BACT|nr:nucleoside phosphorylase [Neolewinella xylanilytica]PPK85579.1 uridine phosphorylase [Neolewinella xylanilytica]
MIPGSELILNPDGSVYHLHLLPGQIANDIITVGDPERVAEISRRFDRVELRVAAREFVTHTGELDGRRLTVISTGIGTDNVDIVLNELDALVNIDLERREVKAELTVLNLLRLGTSGALQPDLPLGSILLSAGALSADGLMPYYGVDGVGDDFGTALSEFVTANGLRLPVDPLYFSPVLPDFLNHPAGKQLPRGVTLTAAGFYAPQGRSLRLPTRLHPELLDVLRRFDYRGLRITNIEMETAGIYGLANALGHRSASLSALLANRGAGTFSKNPAAAVDALIDLGLLLLTDRDGSTDAA